MKPLAVLKRPIFLLDVEGCSDYLCTEASEDVAWRWKKSLDRTIRLIRQFPEVGRLRNDLPLPGIRSFFLKGYPRYLVFYRVEPDHIELLRVRHAMMHLPRLFDRALPPPDLGEA
jgi:plasmid stabilization system protein ParE